MESKISAESNLRKFYEGITNSPNRAEVRKSIDNFFGVLAESGDSEKISEFLASTPQTVNRVSFKNAGTYEILKSIGIIEMKSADHELTNFGREVFYYLETLEKEALARKAPLEAKTKLLR